MNTSIREKTDGLFKVIFHITGILVIAVLAGIFLMLLWNTTAFFLKVKPLDFISGTQWDPSGKGAVYGILPLLVSTFIVTFGAMAIAIPLGIGTAAFLSEYAGKKLKSTLKPAIEMLAAVPSVTIGFLGIVLVGPGIAKMTGQSNGLNALNGAILLAVMALPTIITVAEDAINSVPLSYREASYAVGANRWQTFTRLILPTAA